MYNRIFYQATKHINTILMNGKFKLFAIYSKIKYGTSKIPLNNEIPLESNNFLTIGLKQAANIKLLL